MKYLFAICCTLLALTSAQAQFQVGENGLMIIVSDGTDAGKNSEIQDEEAIPSSYDYVEGKGKDGKMSPKGGLEFTDPIRSLGMKNCIQAAAFLERPTYGKAGFLLIFSLNDSIGGKQATLTMPDGNTYKGVYRLVKQKTSADEIVPPGMTNYQVEGTFFMLGIS